RLVTGVQTCALPILWPSPTSPDLQTADWSGTRLREPVLGVPRRLDLGTSRRALCFGDPLNFDCHRIYRLLKSLQLVRKVCGGNKIGRASWKIIAWNT